MRGYVIRRLLAAVPALLGVYTLVFILLHIVPGDPAMVMLGEGSASVEHLAALRRETGLDRPLPEQYLRSILGLLRGDLGRSIRYNRPVTDLLWEFFPYTLQLAGAGLGLAHGPVIVTARAGTQRVASDWCRPGSGLARHTGRARGFLGRTGPRPALADGPEGPGGQRARRGRARSGGRPGRCSRCSPGAPRRCSRRGPAGAG